MSGSNASLSFDIDSSQAQRAVSVLQTLVQQSQATLAATQQLKAGTTDLSTSYAQNATELTRLADQTRAFGGTLGGLVAQLNSLRATFTTTQAGFNQYAGMLTQAQAFALQLNTSIEGIDRFVSKAQQLNMTTQDLATPLSRITEALRAQSVEGVRLRTVFDSLGISISGLKPNDAAEALQRLTTASRAFRDDPGKVQAFAQFGIAPQDMLALQRQPYQPMLEREQAQRDQEQRARVDQMQANIGRLTAETQNQRDLTADLGRKFTTDASWLGRMGLSPGGGQGYFTSDADRLRRLQEIERMPPAEQAPYRRYGFAAQQDFATSYFPMLGRHFTSGEFTANQSANYEQFLRESQQSRYGMLGAAPGFLGRGFLNLTTSTGYTPPRDIMEDLRQQSPAETLRQRAEAATSLSQIMGQNRPMQMVDIEAMQRRQAQSPGLQDQYRQFFGEDAGRQMGLDTARLTQAQRYLQRPEQELADQTNRSRYLLSLRPEERQTAEAQLQMWQRLHPGIDPSMMGVTPGAGLGAATGIGGGTPLGNREAETRAEALSAQQQAVLQPQRENTQATIQLNRALAESLKDGAAAAENTIRADEQYQAVLKLTNNELEARKAAEDALGVSMAQRVTQGRSLIQQIEQETAAINQRATDAQRYANADPIARQAYALAGGIETDIQQKIRGGQLPNPAGGTYTPRDALTGRRTGADITVSRQDAEQEIEDYRQANLARLRAQGTATGEEVRGGLQRSMEGGQRVAALQGQGMPLQQAQQRVQLEQQIEAALAQEAATIASLGSKTDENSVKAREDAESRQKGLEAVQATVAAITRQVSVQQEINNLMERTRQLAEQTATTISAIQAPMWMRTLIQSISSGLAGLAGAGAGPGPATAGGGAQANISGVFGVVSGVETGGGVAGRGADVNTGILNPATGQPASTASGYFQIVDSTWQEGMKRAGFSPEEMAKYPRALGAPPEIQARVASGLPLSSWRGTIPGKPGAAELLIQQHPNLNMNMTLGQAATAIGEPALPTMMMTQPGGPVVPSPVVTGGAAGAQTAGLLTPEETPEAARILAEKDLEAGWHNKTPQQIALLNAYGQRMRAQNAAGVGLNLANLRDQIQAAITASNRRIQAAPQGEAQRQRAGIVDDPSIPPELRQQERQIREDQLRQQQREAGATGQADLQYGITVQQRQAQTYTGTLAEQLAKQRELDAEIKVEAEVRAHSADGIDVQAAKSRALIGILEQETAAILKNTQQMQQQLAANKAAADASSGGPLAAQRAADLSEINTKLEALQITRSKTTDPDTLKSIDAQTAALQKQTELYDQNTLAAQRRSAGLEAEAMGRSQQIQQANNALGPFATPLAEDRSRRYMELAQKFAATPGLEQSQQGQDLLKANQAQDAIAKQTQAMQDYREATHSVTSAIEASWDSVIDRSQTAGQAVRNLADNLEKIAIRTFVTKPFERLMDETFTSIFGSTAPEPGSAGDTKGATGESVYGLANRLARGESKGGGPPVAQGQGSTTPQGAMPQTAGDNVDLLGRPADTSAGTAAAGGAPGVGQLMGGGAMGCCCGTPGGVAGGAGGGAGGLVGAAGTAAAGGGAAGGGTTVNPADPLAQSLRAELQRRGIPATVTTGADGGGGGGGQTFTGPGGVQSDQQFVKMDPNTGKPVTPVGAVDAQGNNTTTPAEANWFRGGNTAAPARATTPTSPDWFMPPASNKQQLDLSVPYQSLSTAVVPTPTQAYDPNSAAGQADLRRQLQQQGALVPDDGSGASSNLLAGAAGSAGITNTGATNTGGGDVNTGGGDVVNIGGSINLDVTGGGGGGGGGAGGGAGGNMPQTGPGLLSGLGLFGATSSAGATGGAMPQTSSDSGILGDTGGFLSKLFGGGTNTGTGGTGGGGTAGDGSGVIDTGTFNVGTGGGGTASAGLLSLADGGDSGLSLGGGPRISPASDVSNAAFIPSWQQGDGSGDGSGLGLSGATDNTSSNLVTSGGGTTTSGGSMTGSGPSTAGQVGGTLALLGGGFGSIGKAVQQQFGGQQGGFLSGILGHAGGFTGWATDKILGQGAYSHGGLIGMAIHGGIPQDGKGGAGGGGGTPGTPKGETQADLKSQLQDQSGKASGDTSESPSLQTDGTTTTDNQVSSLQFDNTGAAGSGGTGALQSIAGDTGLPPGLSGWADTSRWDLTGSGTGAGIGGAAAVDQTSTDIASNAASFDFSGGLFDQFAGGTGDVGGDFAGGLDSSGAGALDTGAGSFDTAAADIPFDTSTFAKGGIVTRFAAGGLASMRTGIVETPTAFRFAEGGGLASMRNSVVEAPTVFRFAGGVGMAGEAGSEAILPLKRDGSGRLGVSAGNFGNSGGGGDIHNHTWNITTPDANSFMRTRNQVENNVNLSISKARARNST